MQSPTRLSAANGNQQPAAIPRTSSSSPSTIKRRLTKAHTLTHSPATSVTQLDRQATHQPPNDSLPPASSSFTNSISSFQSESLSSKFKFEITPESVHQFNQQQQARARVQWKTRHASLLKANKVSQLTTASSTNLTSSSIDLNTSHTVTETLPQPESSETEQDLTLKCTSMTLITTDDEEAAELRRVFGNQGSQVIVTSPTPKKKVSSATSRQKKIVSASKRPSQTNATQLVQVPVQQPAVPSTSTTDLTTVSKSTISSLAKADEPNPNKNIITIDTSKARSNVEVVRLCIRELGWKEVTPSLHSSLGLIDARSLVFIQHHSGLGHLLALLLVPRRQHQSSLQFRPSEQVSRNERSPAQSSSDAIVEQHESVVRPRVRLLPENLVPSRTNPTVQRRRPLPPSAGQEGQPIAHHLHRQTIRYTRETSSPSKLSSPLQMVRRVKGSISSVILRSASSPTDPTSSKVSAVPENLAALTSSSI